MLVTQVVAVDISKFYVVLSSEASTYLFEGR